MSPPEPFIRPVLEAARGLLLPPGVWIKGHYMLDEWNVPCLARDTPVKFSAEGAIMRAAWIMRHKTRPPILYLERVIDRRGAVSLASANDARQTTLPTVLSWFNTAIMQLGGQPEYLPFLEEE